MIYTIHIDVYLSPLSLYTIHPFPRGGRWRPELLPRPQLAACCIENGTGGAGGHGVRWTEGAAESLGTCGEHVEEIRCGCGRGMILDDRMWM